MRFTTVKWCLRKNKEWQRAEGKEQRAKSKEQRAKSREQRAKGEERRAELNLLILAQNS
jgi:hypothetical protein